MNERDDEREAIAAFIRLVAKNAPNDPPGEFLRGALEQLAEFVGSGEYRGRGKN